MKPFGIIGDSHTGIFVRALRAAGEEQLLDGGPLGAGNNFFVPFFEAADGDVVFKQPGLQSNYASWKSLTASRGIVDFRHRLIVSMGLSGASFCNSQVWRRHAPSQAANERRRFVSSGLVEAMIEALQHNVLLFYRHCLSQELLVAAIAAPPPQPHAPFFQVLGKDSVFELYRRYQQPVRSLLREHGIPIIEPDWTDETGYLMTPFNGDDPHHAGMSCGAVVAAAIKRELGGTSKIEP